MPLLSDEQLVGAGTPQQINAPVTYRNQTPFADQVMQVIGEESSVGMMSRYLTDRYFSPVDAKTPFDPNFDPFDPSNLRGYESFADSFSRARNADEMNFIKSKIDREMKIADSLGNSGMSGVMAGLVGGIVDPVNLIPVGGQAAKAYQLGRVGRALQGAGRTAAAGFVASGVNEAIAQGTQETRTAAQSAESIAAATVFSGVLGGAISGIAGGPRSVPLAAENAARESRLYADAVGATQGEASVGAASVQNTTMAQETLISAAGLEKLMKFQDPVLRTANSPSIETRRIAQQLAEQPLMREKNAEGIASPIAVETAIRGWNGPLATASSDLEDAFVKYRLGRDRRAGDMTVLGVRDVAGSDRLTFDQFREEVGRAMRNGDQHELPEVASAAQSMRRNLFDPLKEAAIRHGLLPEDVKPDTADSYLTRIYDVPKIVAERHQFEGVLTDWLRRRQTEALYAHDTAKPDPSRPDTVGRTIDDATWRQMTDLDLRDIAAQITDHIVGLAPGRLPYQPVPLLRGPLKERTLAIADAAIEPWLESDIGKVSRTYARTMAADVELTRAFGRADLQDQIDKITANYAQLREGVTDPKELTRLDKLQRQDVRDIEGMRDRMRGTYGIPDNPHGLAVRSARVAKNLNFLRLLGGMTLSSLADAGSVVLKQGIMRTVGDGVVPMLRSFKQFRLAADEVKLAGNALDMVLDERNMALADVFDEHARVSRFERGLEWAGHKYGFLTLMSPWNSAIKQLGGVVSQTRILEAVTGYAKAAPNEVRRLAFLGVDRGMADRIAKEFKAHGSTEKGIRWANTAHWADQEAARAYRAALSKEVNLMVVTPGQDKPFWMSTQLGGVLGQFHSFAIASVQRVMLSGLQQRDMAAFNGMLAMTGLGMLSYGLKAKPEDVENASPAQLVQEGIDRAGLTGWLFDVNNIAEKATGGRVGISRLTGKEASRYASRDVLGAVLGPTTDLIKKSVDTVGNAARGQVTQKDIHNIRQMLPFQNIFYLRSLFDQAEQGINEAFSIPKQATN